MDASTTDHTLLERAGIQIHTRRSPYAIRDKYQTLNWLIRSANGRRRLKVNPRCRELILDMRFMVYKGTDVPEKSDPARSHHSDALGYCALGAMKPLIPERLKARLSTSIRVW